MSMSLVSGVMSGLEGVISASPSILFMELKLISISDRDSNILIGTVSQIPPPNILFSDNSKVQVL